MTILQKARNQYEKAHKEWFETSIFAPKEQKEKVDKNLKEARAKYDLAYKAQFPNHEIINL